MDCLLFLLIHFFSNKELRRLHLSENRFKQITFTVAHLKHLSSLAMRNNSIEYLDEDSRNSLDSLYTLQLQLPSKTVLIDFQGNPFSCDCKAFEFLH